METLRTEGLQKKKFPQKPQDVPDLDTSETAINFPLLQFGRCGGSCRFVRKTSSTMSSVMLAIMQYPTMMPDLHGTGSNVNK